MKRTASVFPSSWLVRALALSLIAACAPPEDSESIDEVDNSIIGGTPTTGDPAVVALFAQRPGSTSGSLCTSTLVSPTVLLTAAHCVHPSLVGSGVRFSAILDPVLRTATRRVAVRQVHWHSSFNPSNPFAGNDIAVAILASPLNNITAIPVNTTVLGPGNVGQSARLVGYGNNNGALGTGSGTKRVVTTQIVRVSAGLVQIGRTGAGTCQGDSGGPAFGTLGAGGRERVFGITSFGQRGCGGAGSFTRVDRHGAFLGRFLPATFSAEEVVEPEGVEPDPDPAAIGAP